MQSDSQLSRRPLSRPRLVSKHDVRLTRSLAGLVNERATGAPIHANVPSSAPALPSPSPLGTTSGYVVALTGWPYKRCHSRSYTSVKEQGRIGHGAAFSLARVIYHSATRNEPAPPPLMVTFRARAERRGELDEVRAAREAGVAVTESGLVRGRRSGCGRGRRRRRRGRERHHRQTRPRVLTSPQLRYECCTKGTCVIPRRRRWSWSPDDDGGAKAQSRTFAATPALLPRAPQTDTSSPSPTHVFLALISAGRRHASP
ncbi:hypothetical protein B0H12DRAFT_785718 [Mycena haematopus]|nr:hypothetical protein B0H12DRAFT_785718 [Mycena haematopus]